jgi:hypothetical protein
MRQLANAMKLSPSLEAASCAVAQEFPEMLLNRKVYFPIHKCFSLFPILNK